MQRLRLLGEPLRLRARDLALIATLAAAGTATAAVAVVERVPEAQIYFPRKWICPFGGEARGNDLSPACPQRRPGTRWPR